ncbi:MAG: MATE family efflux transporter [Acidaminococcaceae bacterium]|nr:MATE family efflux transporter [Acidaminococcaceae bacterium]
MEEVKELEVFRSAPVPKAVLKTTVPAMAAMLMVLVYNLADTFFIGLTRDAYQMAAVSMAMPVFLIFMSVGTVFGIGGTSVISRALGEGRLDYAKKVCSFCMWSCVAVGVIMSAAFLLGMEQILALMGTSPDTHDFVKVYLTIVSLGGPFVLISHCYSNVVRAEGQSEKAMMGQLLGNLLNVILDPVMISGLGWGIAGAAVATVIGNVFGAGYYLLYFLRKQSILSIRPTDFSVKDGISGSVLAIGIPASLGSLTMSLSQIIMNSEMATFGDMAVAGIGVASKVVMLTGMLCIGFGQGVQPLLGYCIGAKLWERFKKIMRFSLIFALSLSIVMTVVCYIFSDWLVSVFLTEPQAFDYGVLFVRILLTTSFLFGVFYVLANALQAAGAATASLIVNLSRQGIIYIPALFILKPLLGATGLVWAQPVADLLSIILVAVMYVKTVDKMECSVS